MTSLWTLDSSLVLAPSTSFVPRKIAARLERDPESGPRAYCKVRAEVSRSENAL